MSDDGETSRPPSGPRRAYDRETPPQGRTLKQLADDIANQPDALLPNPTLANVVERLDSLLDQVTAPNGRIASMGARIDSMGERVDLMLCGLRSVALAVGAMEELQGAMPVTSDHLKDLVVMVVDDEVLIQAVLSRVIRCASGKRPVLASTAANALEFLRSIAIDVALVDIKMPGTINGVELCQRIRDEYPGIGVVLMSGAVDDYNAESARTLNIRVLEKPFKNSAMIAAIQEAHAARPAAGPQAT